MRVDDERSVAIAIRPDGARCAVRHLRENRLCVMDVRSGTFVASKRFKHELARELAYTNRGDRIVVSDGRGMALLDEQTLEERARLALDGSRQFAVTPDGAIAYVDVSDAGIVRVDLDHLAVQGEQAAPFESITSLATDKQGEWLAVGGGEHASVAITRFGSGSWRLLGERLGDRVNALAFSPDRRWLAMGGTLVRVYSLESGAVVFEERGNVTKSVAFTRDGDRLLAPFGASLLVIHTGRWSTIATFRDNRRGIEAMAYCPATETVLACDKSRDIRVFRTLASPELGPAR